MQTEIKYGFIIGVLMIGGIYTEYYAGFHGASLAGGTPALSSMFFLIIGVVMGIREKKREEKNGLSYKQAFLTGLTISFIAGLILGCYSYVYVNLINPNYIKQTLYYYQQNLQSRHLTDSEIKSRVASYGSILSPVSQFMSATGISVLIGLLVSGIASFFFKNKTPKSHKGDLLA